MYQLTGEDPRPIVYLFYPNRIEGYNLYITLTTGFFFVWSPILSSFNIA